MVLESFVITWINCLDFYQEFFLDNCVGVWHFKHALPQIWYLLLNVRRYFLLPLVCACIITIVMGHKDLGAKRKIVSEKSLSMESIPELRSQNRIWNNENICNCWQDFRRKSWWRKLLRSIMSRRPNMQSDSCYRWSFRVSCGQPVFHINGYSMGHSVVMLDS